MQQGLLSGPATAGELALSPSERQGAQYDWHPATPPTEPLPRNLKDKVKQIIPRHRRREVDLPEAPELPPGSEPLEFESESKLASLKLAAKRKYDQKKVAMATKLINNTEQLQNDYMRKSAAERAMEEKDAERAEEQARAEHAIKELQNQLDEAQSSVAKNQAEAENARQQADEAQATMQRVAAQAAEQKEHAEKQLEKVTRAAEQAQAATTVAAAAERERLEAEQKRLNEILEEQKSVAEQAKAVAEQDFTKAQHKLAAAEHALAIQMQLESQEVCKLLAVKYRTTLSDKELTRRLNWITHANDRNPHFERCHNPLIPSELPKGWEQIHMHYPWSSSELAMALAWCAEVLRLQCEEASSAAMPPSEDLVRDTWRLLVAMDRANSPLGTEDPRNPLYKRAKTNQNWLKEWTTATTATTRTSEKHRGAEKQATTGAVKTRSQEKRFTDFETPTGSSTEPNDLRYAHSAALGRRQQETSHLPNRCPDCFRPIPEDSVCASTSCRHCHTARR